MPVAHPITDKSVTQRHGVKLYVAAAETGFVSQPFVTAARSVSSVAVCGPHPTT